MAGIETYGKYAEVRRMEQENTVLQEGNGKLQAELAELRKKSADLDIQIGRAKVIEARLIEGLKRQEARQPPQ